MKTINYEEYKYKNILKNLDELYELDTDKKDYSALLLTMNKAKKFSKCIKIYNIVYNKYRSLKDSFLKNSHKSIYESEITLCLNENIVRIVEGKQNIRPKDFLQGYVNLRSCDDFLCYESRLIAYGQKHLANWLTIQQSLVTITETKKALEQVLAAANSKKHGTNGYKSDLSEIKRLYKILGRFGYIKTVNDYSVWNHSLYQYHMGEMSDTQMYILIGIVSVIAIILIIYCWALLIALSILFVLFKK